ncbi:MAG: hypothetical protein CMA12_07175 [Euryarchaeota archaeon]|nr:hypothetical protein [Euryarchaeota archaeon]
MRKVRLNWKPSSLFKINEIYQMMKICERIEVLGHLSIDSGGVSQLTELQLNDGHKLSEISELESFEVLEKFEEDENGILASIRCTHTMAKSAIQLSNIYVYPPYGINSESGLEIRIFGLSDSIRSFLGLINNVMPPDIVSVNTIKDENSNEFDFLTEKQKEALVLAVNRGYYDIDSDVTLKQLSDELGIARSTFGEHLKRAESGVLKMVASDLL